MLPERFQDAIRLILERALVPSIGDVRIVQAGTAPRSGWMTWSDALVSRETYAELFRVIGPRYGDGDGVTTFQLGPAGLADWLPDGVEYQVRVR